MIADLPRELLIALLSTSFLGAVIGYLIARIVARRRTNAIVRQMETDIANVRTDSEVQIRLISDETEELKLSLSEANERAEAALKQEESIDVHAQLLAQRIQSLEAQLASYEEQQIRLQRDFATYKVNKTRELELARVKPESWSRSEHLPLLSKRIEAESQAATQAQRSERSSRIDHSLPHDALSVSRAAASSKLSLPLSKELDIPSLAESELPDSVEELEFELAEADSSGDS